MKNKQTRILIFGTYDFVHYGHLHMMRQARALAANPYLIVSVARSVNVKKIKGAKPLFSDSDRIKMLGELKLVDEVVLSAASDYISHIAQLRPDIIALGYDQKAYTADLASKLKDRGANPRIVRLKSYKPKVLKTSLLKQRT